jgi:hypothetical protein
MDARLTSYMIWKDLTSRILFMFNHILSNFKFFSTTYFLFILFSFINIYIEFILLLLFICYTLSGGFNYFLIKLYLTFMLCILYYLFRQEVAGQLILPFFLCIYYICINYLDLKMRALRRHIHRCDGIRNHYHSRMLVYTTICGSTLLAFLLLWKTLVPIIYGNKKQESKLDIDRDPLVPTFAKSNVPNRERYHFTPQLEHKAKTSRHDEMLQLLSKGILIVRITQDDFCQEVRGIPDGSEVILPLHAFPKRGLFDVEICADYSKRTSSYKMKNVSSDLYIQMKDPNGKPVDCALLHLDNLPTQKALGRYFSQTQLPKEGPAQELYKQLDGRVEVIDVRVETPSFIRSDAYKTVHGEFSRYPRYITTAENYNSEAGMCGSPVVSEASNCILGIHVCGTGTNEWYTLKLSGEMIQNARELLKQNCRTFISHPIPTQFSVKNNFKQLQFPLECESLAVEEIGVNCSAIEEIGHVLQANGDLFKPIAQTHYFENKNPALEEAFGPRNFQPPVHLNGDEQINTTLIKLNSPKFDVPIDLIDRAAIDYLETSHSNISFNKIINELKATRNDFFSVRSLDEAKRGDGTGVIRGINNNSASGCLYGGKKTRHYNMDVDGDPYEIREFLPYMINDLENQEIEWRAGRGTYDPFCRNSKSNEILPWDKAQTKTRSFYGNDMVFFLNMTRGIIPLKHVLRYHKSHSECFVGISAQSSQWNELRNFITKDGEYSKFVCGDFSGYDTQLPKALLDKAAWILLEFARRGGMNKSDLTFLSGALSSVVSPTLFWQGHILRMANGQPSGQPLTVEINSIVNSLLMRMTFFTIMDEFYPKVPNPVFRDYVRLATYGDDNVLGVKDTIPHYNHTMIQSVFARWGIQYTMADKNADSVPYQSIDKVSFLKRTFKKHQELGIVGAIEVESIVKSFYYYVKRQNTNLTPPQQFDELVKSQVREAVLHGREFYDWFCNGVKTVAAGSKEQKPFLQIKFNGYYLPRYEDLIDEVKEAYIQ